MVRSKSKSVSRGDIYTFPIALWHMRGCCHVCWRSLSIGMYVYVGGKVIMSANEESRCNDMM
jgi:hypothetical protein